MNVILNYFHLPRHSFQDTTRDDDGSKSSAVGLENLGDLHGQLALCLGIAAVVLFVSIAASTRSIGKVGS